MHRITLLITLLIISLHSDISAQTAYTKKIDCIPMGETADGVTPYLGGYLLCSQQWGTTNIPNMVRKIGANDSIENTIRFDSTFAFYFHTVGASNSNIFVFGVPTFISSQVVNFIIMDSAFTVLHQKQIQVPFNIVTCKFFPAMDGGVIGVVQEVCNESRIFRLDQQGNIIWIKNYVGIIQPPGGYDRTIVNRIDLMASGKYMISGHLGYGYGPFAFTIDDFGTLINSKVIELFPNGFNSDVVRLTGFNGTQLFFVIDNETNGMDTTYIVIMDTSLNVLQTRRVILSDSAMRVRAIIPLANEFVCAFSMASYPPFDSVRVAVCGFDKLTGALNWIKETQYDDSTTEYSYGSLCGTFDGFDNPVFFGNYGQMNFQNNGGNNFDFLALTKLDAASHNGFCDGVTSTGICTPVNYINTPYYMVILSSATYAVVTQTHNLSTVPIVQPITVCGPSVSVEEIFSDNVIPAYPNPTSGLISFSSPLNVVVTDIYGNAVVALTNTISVDLSEQPAAVYVIREFTADGVYLGTTKVVKQ